jgi:hypothetical protein
MSQTNGIATTGSANLASQQQRLADLEGDLMKFELAKIATGGILREIRDDALFLVAGGTGSRAYADFASYCADRWNLGDREVARRIEAFENVQLLIEAGVDPLQAPRNPWQAREVAVLMNQVGLPVAVSTWRKALTDSQDPKINPAGMMTGAFLKDYVTSALHANGKQRRSGTPRPRPSTGTNAGVQTSVPAPTIVTGPAAVATAPAPAPAAAPATTTPTTLQVAVTVTADVSVLPALAADVKDRRLHIANPLTRRPLFGGVALLLAELEKAMVKTAATSAEGQALQAALTSLADRIAEKAS